jgi:DNA repair exonuclease SbcCD nuclease subunit
MPHKILLLSDIHFGVRNNSDLYLSLIENIFYKNVKDAIDTHHITDVRILGDLMDNRNTINVKTFNSVLNAFRYFNKEYPKVHFKILLGNHETYYHNRLDVNSLELLRDLPNITIIDRVTEEVINGKSIITFPWFVKDTETDIAFNNISSGNKKYDLCFGHFEINGFEVVPGMYHEDGCKTEAFKNFGRVFSGHFHIRGSKGHISYLGCPLPLTWADYGNEKGLHVYDIESGTTTFIQNTTSPKYVKVNMQDFIDKNVDSIKKIKGNFVKFIIDKKYEDTAIIKSIQIAEGMNPLKIEVENNYVDIKDFEESGIDPSKMSDPLMFIHEYIKTIDIDSSIDKSDFTKYITNLYTTVITENS